ncbi:MCE family protein [Actinokineospora inagensis]|uniref:MCE family protein n=1 Tax=Actinokineospora inagensis TaxID=103730 RepID=UPI00047DEBAF|nr:MCE family protein [Actinokineospora inagensis]
MRSFRSRNPVPIGLVSLLTIGLVLLAAVYSDDLPIIGGGTTYSAEFAEAAGLRPDDEVRIAGVKVGSVSDVSLDRDRVVVRFKVKDAWVGDQSRAEIKIKTLLGQKFLALDPVGTKVLDPGTRIPRDRTTAPYDVLEAFRGLADTANDIDTTQLAKSFEVLSQTFADTPGDVRGALNGLQSLSRTISSRDRELAHLLANTKQISTTLADRDAEVTTLLSDGSLLLNELNNRKNAIAALLTGTKDLSTQLQGLVSDNTAQLGPVLQNLDQLTAMLQRNQDALAEGIKKFAPFVRQFNNAIGTGRWFDNYICGLLPPSIGPVNQQGCLGAGK